MRVPASILLAVILLAGCGYHVQGRGDGLPAGIRTVYIDYFQNRTLEPFLDSVVSESITERFVRGRFLKVVDRPEFADAILSGEVTAYATAPVAYDEGDDIARYSSTMTVAARFSPTASRETLWKGSVTWSEEYPASRDKTLQEDNESAAIRALGERIAEEIYFRIGDNF